MLLLLCNARVELYFLHEVIEMRWIAMFLSTSDQFSEGDVMGLLHEYSAGLGNLK